MNRTSTSRNKLLLFFVILIFIIGIFSGVVYYFKIDKELKDLVFDNFLSLLNDKNVLNINFYHLMLILFLSFTSFILIGFFISFFALFYEGFSIGVILSAFAKEKMLRGIIYGFIYILSSKLVFIFLLLILIIISFKLFKLVINRRNNRETYYLNIYYCLKWIIVILIIAVFNELVLIPLFNKICCYFAFLIN